VHPFRAAIEAEDHDAIPALLSEDVEFLSPASHRPYHGRQFVSTILIRGPLEVFEDFRYVHEIESGDGRDHALIFKARIGDREVHGCDFLRHDDAGQISELCVMVRPLSALRALAEAMESRFEVVQGELGIPG
jgi:hypothetical protein